MIPESGRSASAATRSAASALLAVVETAASADFAFPACVGESASRMSVPYLLLSPLHRPSLPPRLVGRPQQLHQPAAFDVDLAGTCGTEIPFVGSNEALLVMGDSDRGLQQVGARPTLGVVVLVERRLDHPETRQRSEGDRGGPEQRAPNPLG